MNENCNPSKALKPIWKITSNDINAKGDIKMNLVHEKLEKIDQTFNIGKWRSAITNFDYDNPHENYQQYSIQHHGTEILIQSKFKIKNIDVYDKPLLHAFSIAGVLDRNTIKIMLPLGENVNLKDELGQTPLHLVSTHTEKDSHLRTAEILLKEGANILAKDKMGRTPLDYFFGSDKKLSNPGVKRLFIKHLTKPIVPLKLWMDGNQGTLSRDELEARRIVEKEAKKMTTLLVKLRYIILLFLCILLCSIYIFYIFYTNEIM